MEEKIYSYEVTQNGYFILINGVKVIHQYEPYIPDKTKTYKENAETQIEEMKAYDKKKKTEKTQIEQIQEDITDLQLALTEIYEMGV